MDPNQSARLWVLAFELRSQTVIRCLYQLLLLLRKEELKQGVAGRREPPTFLV